MKKFLLGLIVGFLLATAVGATASQNIRLIINGKEIKTDVPPQLINGRVMVPARFVAEPLGAKVEWDEKNKIILITKKINQINSIAQKEQNETYYTGRTILNIIAQKYPDKKITGLGSSNILQIDDIYFELPYIIKNNALYFSIKPLIKAGLLTQDDL